ncbi:MAG TPA: aminotransferase class IV [Bacteroidales bacterium]|nr:aminotransferase class IV [Bacteroidales bacterium]
MYRFIESIRVEHRQFQHLEQHEWRFQRTRNHFFPGAAKQSLCEALSIPNHISADVYKCRIVYDQTIQQIEFTPYQPKRIQTLHLTEANHLDYAFKYEDRQVFHDLLNRKAGADDILIVQYGWITDTSFSNIALFDGERWITPKRTLLNGTSRQRLLRSGQLIEQDIHINELHRFSHMQLVNAMLLWQNRPEATQPFILI